LSGEDDSILVVEPARSEFVALESVTERSYRDAPFGGTSFERGLILL
jgi:hypothetical protein